MASQRLRLNPNKEHKPESYDDMQLDFSPSIFSSLERYLPPNMLGMPRYDKVKFMREILLKYLPHGERNRVSFLSFSFVELDFLGCWFDWKGRKFEMEMFWSWLKFWPCLFCDLGVELGFVFLTGKWLFVCELRNWPWCPVCGEWGSLAVVCYSFIVFMLVCGKLVKCWNGGEQFDYDVCSLF